MTHVLWPMDIQHLLLADIMKERAQKRAREKREIRFQFREEKPVTAWQTAEQPNEDSSPG